MKSLYSTFQAAEILGVSPDTVLKWIKAGKITATRTLGGHFRIEKNTLDELASKQAPHHPPATTAPPQKTFQYCWEFNAIDDKLRDECRRCLVYKARAKLCYELNTLPEELGLSKLFCDSNCEECDYRGYVKNNFLNILVVTDDNEFLKDFQIGGATYSFKVTSCEYECSAIVEIMRPAFAIIDCSFPHARGFCDYLSNDIRIPDVKIILASNTDITDDFNTHKIIGRISSPPKFNHIESFLKGLPV